MKKVLERLEIPTWLVIAAIHGGWFSATYFHASIPAALLAVIGALLTCWHMHLQHEILHGHPTRWRYVNELFAYLPAALWIPYPIYRDSHMAHHSTEELTKPQDDTESYYLQPEQWHSLPWPIQQILIFNNSVAGRMLVGPVLTVGRFWREELSRILRGDFSNIPAWTGHAVVVAGVVFWLQKVCGFPIGLYILTFALPGTALALVRSYLEHRPAPDNAARTAIVESPLFGLLFLNNNYHVVHHDHPGMPWYRIPTFFRANRDTILQRNGNYFFKGYQEVFQRYLLTPKDLPVHPGAAIADTPVESLPPRAPASSRTQM